MPPVFGRQSHPTHRYDAALQTWLSSPYAADRAMARNVMYDHRVSVWREQSFDRFVGPTCDSNSLRKACNNYFNQQVRNRSLPEYVYNVYNSANLINAAWAVPPLVNKDRKLVRILNLNKLGLVFQWARTARKWPKTFDTFPGAHDQKQLGIWLDKRIALDSKEHITRIIEALNIYGKTYPFQPTWATTLDAFSPHISSGADRWLQAVGVSPTEENWIIILCYTVREAGTLVRPTQLDAGWYAHHFPSPPSANLTTGGHPMDLRVKPKPTTLLPEYIHKHIPHPVEHWTSVGPLFDRTSKLSSEDLVKQRRCHYELLLRTYGPVVQSWMNTWI